MQNNRFFSTRDETLWLYGCEPVAGCREMTNFLMRLPVDAVQFEKLSCFAFPDEIYTFGTVNTRTECRDGMLAFGMNGLNLLSTCGKGCVRRFDWRHGLSGPASDLQEDPAENKLWFVMNGQAVCFNRQIDPVPVPAAECWEEIPILPGSGLFQPSPGEIACFSKDGSALMRWNGTGWRSQRIPFDPGNFYQYGSDSRSDLYVGDGKVWYKIDAQGVHVEDQVEIVNNANYGQAPWQPCDPVETGGRIVYPIRDRGSYMTGDPVRVFENHQFSVRSYGTPFAGQYILRMCEDESGDLWFLTSLPHLLHPFRTVTGEVGLRSEHSHLFRYMLSGQRLKCVQPPPDVCERQLIVETKPGITPRQRVLLARIEGSSWLRMNDGESSALFRFPTNGVYRCEIAAFEYGGAVPGTVSFKICVHADLPDTKRIETSCGPVRISSWSWCPPVLAVPSSEESNEILILWRHSGDSQWKELGIDGQMDLLDLKRGMQTLEFVAEEDGFWRDVTPLCLEVDVALSLEEYLVFVAEALRSRDPVMRKRAENVLKAYSSDAKSLLDQLNDSSQRLEKIRSALSILDDSTSKQ